MAINFPTCPSTNDTFTAGSITYKWDGTKWIGLGVTPTDRLIEGSNSLEINASNELVWTGGTSKFGGVLQADQRLVVNGAGGKSGASDTLLNYAGDGSTVTASLTADGAGYFKGSVGINELTPDSKLDIVHSTAENSATENLIHLRTDPSAGYASRGLFVKVGRDGAYDNSAVHYDIVGSAGNSGFHAFEVQGNEVLRITKDLKVGINETNPARQLSVYDASNSGVEIKSNNDGQSSVFFTDTDDGNIGMIGYTHNNDEMFFRVNDQTRLTIDSGGQVGLNVTDPSDRLHVKGATLQEGYSDGAVVKSMVMTASFGAGTHDIFTCGATGVDNSAVATMEYVSLFAYSGNNHCAGIKLASTRRSSNNTAWENLPNVNVAGPNGSDTSKDPNLFFQNGVLMVTIPGSTQVTATVRITTRSFTLVRNYSAG